LEELPEHYTGDDRFGFRYLQGCGWNHEKAYKDIFEHREWMAKTFPMDGSSFDEFLQSGALYVAGRARPGFQPVIVLNVKKFVS